MGTAHSTLLLRVVMGLWTSRERSEPEENSARRCEQHPAPPLRPESRSRHGQAVSMEKVRVRLTV